MSMTQSGAEGVLEATREAEAEEFPGLCRVCGGAVPRAGDQRSCTPSICSEQCLARAITSYWAGLGVEARVNLRDGFARLESLRGIFPPTSRPPV